MSKNSSFVGSLVLNKFLLFFSWVISRGTKRMYIRVIGRRSRGLGFTISTILSKCWQPRAPSIRLFLNLARSVRSRFFAHWKMCALSITREMNKCLSFCRTLIIVWLIRGETSIRAQGREIVETKCSSFVFVASYKLK